MKTNAYSFLFIFFLIIIPACVPLPELQSAKKALEQNDLVSAHGHYMKVLEKAPGNPEALKGLEDVRARLVSLAIGQAESIVSATPLTVPMIEEAMAKLEPVKQYDPEGKYLRAAREKYLGLLQKIKMENEERAQFARTGIASEQFNVVRDNIEQIKIADPRSALVQPLEKEYTEAYGKFLERKMKSLIKEKRFKEAGGVLAQLKGLNLPEQEVFRLTEFFKEQEVSSIVTQIDAMTAKKQYYKAYLAIVGKGYKDLLSAKLDEIKFHGARFYLGQAIKLKKKGSAGRAYLEAVKGFELDPKLPDMFEIHRDTRDEILKKIQKYIAISAFGAPTDNPDVGPQFSDALISYLFRTLPYGINIVEREKIDMLISEHKREFSEVGNILNVDIIVTGNVSLMRIDKQKSESLSTVRAKVGEKKEVNPEYEMLLKMYQNNPKQMKNMPPPSIIVPIYENFKYKKGAITIKGFSNVTVRIFDTRKGSITYAQEFTANFKVSDDYQDSVEPAGIQGDPIEILSGTEVAEKLRNKIIRQLAEVIQKHFAKREKLFLEDSKYHLKRKEVDKAIDFLAQGFLFCVKAKVKGDNPHFKGIIDLIVEETEKNFQ